MNAAQRNRSGAALFWQFSRRQICGIFRYPIYPFLLAIYVPVWLLSNNLGLFDVGDIIRPVVASIAMVFVAFAVLWALYRDRHKAALATAVGVACFYLFSLLRELLYSPLRELLPSASASAGALTILGLVYLGISLAIRRTPRIGRTATTILNGFLAAMLILPAMKLADLDVESPARANTPPLRLAAPAAGELPNIVHIVLDGYSRADVLRALYGFDNTPFIEALREQGFVVPKRPTAAYSQTLLSMNSIFGLGYINDRVRTLSAAYSDEDMRLILTDDLQKSTLLRSLRSAGYQLISVESLYHGVQLSNADHILSEASERAAISYFEKELLQLTPIHRVLVRLTMKDESYMQVRFGLATHDYSSFRPPYFVYNHILAPHPPFNIAADGQPGDWYPDISDGSHREEAEPDWYENYRAGYVAKVRYTNKALLQKIRYLKANVPDPKIIVVHSDHGSGMLLDLTHTDQSCLKERMSAFVAVYASDPALTADFPDRVNLVNLYRILLQRAFGASLPPLPAHSYFSPWDEPAAFSEMTDVDLKSFGPACAGPGGPIAATRETPSHSVR